MALKRPGSASDPLWYKDAVIYELHVKAFADSNGDGIGDLRGLDPAARLPPGPRRHLPLAAPLLPFPAARRRLRHLGLPEHPPRLRDDGGFPGARRRRARARPADHDRAGHQPHLRPARLVPGGPPRAARLARARLLRLERLGPEVRGRPHHLHRHRKVQLDVGPDRAGVLLAPLLLAPARPELRQPGGRGRSAEGDAATGSTSAWTACGSTRFRTSSSATARAARTCPRRTRSSSGSAPRWTPATPTA